MTYGKETTPAAATDIVSCGMTGTPTVVLITETDSASTTYIFVTTKAAGTFTVADVDAAAHTFSWVAIR